MSKTRDADMVPITAADMERFHRNASEALKRRAGTYAFDEFGAGLRSVFLGGVPVIGLLWFDWSSAQLMFFLLVGTWIAMLCDFAKLWFLEKQIRAWGNASYDNWHVWTIVAALRAERKTAPKSHLGAKYEPWAGVLVDLALGGISTGLICVALAEAGKNIDWQVLQERSVVISLLALVLYQMLFTAWEIFDHKWDPVQDRKVIVAVGIRGLGLFVLMFLMIGLADGWSKDGSAIKIAMLVVNGAIVLWGLATMFGPLFIRQETAWLKDYMQKRNLTQRRGDR